MMKEPTKNENKQTMTHKQTQFNNDIYNFQNVQSLVPYTYSAYFCMYL